MMLVSSLSVIETAPSTTTAPTASLYVRLAPVAFKVGTSLIAVKVISRVELLLKAPPPVPSELSSVTVKVTVLVVRVGLSVSVFL